MSPQIAFQAFQKDIIVIDFGRPNAPWVLLSIDDMNSKLYDLFLKGDLALWSVESGRGGLDVETVNNYFDTIKLEVKEPSTLLVLMLLPALAYRHANSISKLVMTNLPVPTHISPSVINGLVAQNQRCAVLLNVSPIADASNVNVEALLRACDLLDQSSVSPPWARAILSRTDVVEQLYANRSLLKQWLPTLTKDTTKALNEHYTSTWRWDHRGFVRWWQSVDDSMNWGEEWFLSLTTGEHVRPNIASCHDASTLLDPVTVRDIREVTEGMRDYDHHCVWSWCKDAVSNSHDDEKLDEITDTHQELRRRWIAAKAFEYAKRTRNELETIGLFALVYGLTLKAMMQDADSAVKQGLYIPGKIVNPEDVKSNNKHPRLGLVKFKSDQTVSEFFRKMSVWIRIATSNAEAKRRQLFRGFRPEVSKAEVRVIFQFEELHSPSTQEDDHIGQFERSVRQVADYAQRLEWSAGTPGEIALVFSRIS